jgi:lipopolysaccharide transport system ATP-binding protein
MPTAIKFENISKQYRLGVVSTQTLSHDLNRWWKMNIRGKEDPYLKIGEVNDRAHKGESEYVWALKDINFEVQQGDVLGIIGKNGAGKSTLLKILSKVTAPTTGTIKAAGRIASLLEVGTGFHPEMTGRENIYMNGAIMGMTKAEITRRFDEIVDFSGVERYIDTPAKRYSSGMTVRLGFAIAAHLEPEILVVDEVLAVGDAEFQKKAIGKMQDVSRGEGRTVLFVSHNMASIGDLCKNAILLSDGIVKESGGVRDVINFYLGSTMDVGYFRKWTDYDSSPGSRDIKIRELYTVNKNNEKQQYSLTTEEIGVYIEYEVFIDVPFFTHGINLFDSTGIHVFSSHDSNLYDSSIKIEKGIYSTIVWITGNLLQEGDYLVSIATMRYNPFDVIFHEMDLLRIHLVDTFQNSAKNEFCTLELPGIIRPKLLWDVRKKINKIQ